MSHSNLAQLYAPDTRRLARLKQEAAQGRARLAIASTATISDDDAPPGDQVAAAKRFVEKMRAELNGNAEQPAKPSPAKEPMPSPNSVIADPPRTPHGQSRLVALLDTHFPRPVATSFFAAPAASVDDESDEQEASSVIDAADITDAKLDLDCPGLLGFSASKQQWIALPNKFELTPELQAKVFSHTRQAMDAAVREAQPMSSTELCDAMDKLFPNDKDGFVYVDG
jgi:hypothetical protein